MPHVAMKTLLSNNMRLAFHVPEDKTSGDYFDAIKENRNNAWAMYNDIAAEARTKGIPVLVGELQGKGPIQVFTVFVNDLVTEEDAATLKTITDAHIAKREEQTKAVIARL
jgi:hypothetical protein